MKKQIIKGIRETEPLRSSFMKLAETVFGISFAEWYERGYWADLYIPYAYCEENKVIANVSVNLMEFLFEGRKRRYVQIGTVMTDPDYRNQGLAAQLILEALADYRDHCDAVYLFANDSVLDFYPKFGFAQEKEYEYSFSVCKRSGAYRMLDMSDNRDRELLYRCYGRSNPYSAFSFINNEGLLMFYCAGFMKNHIYYVEAADTVIIAETEGEVLRCHDAFGSGNKGLLELMEIISGDDIRTVLLGFTPREAGNMICRERREDVTLFLLSGGENIFQDKHMMFPVCSHA